ncbi:MAG: hypothetical protein ACD_39C01956G0001 [uncultured bacterium]|nr:MAG: hypothetical protein ACD_39C01956G0001 [uncultured bacterium]
MTGRLFSLMMPRYKFIAALLFQLVLLTGAEAADVYTLFNYHDKSEVHLIFSTWSPANPFGKLFSAHPVKAFHIDELNRFRLAFFNQTDDFKPMSRRLHRQVFDGLPVLADKGLDGHAQHQDQRDLIRPDQSGRPVFRSRGAPFSPGPGFMVTPQVAQQSLVPGEVYVLKDKNWYEIPNGSWYQTWLTGGANNSASYMLACDFWEEQTEKVCESVWSGFPALRTDEQTIGEYTNYRLRRVEVDGAMELPASSPGIITQMDLPSKVAVFQYGAPASNSFKTLMYSWSGDAPGTLYAENQRLNCDTIFESQHEQARFPALLDEKRLIVMGTDLLHRWLKAQGLQHENAECTFCVLVPARNNAHALFVYSAPDNMLYRFFIDEVATMDMEKPQITNLAFAPAAITKDNEGNLILGGFSVWPLSMSDDEDLLMSVEAIDLAPKTPGTDKVKGTITLAQQYYFNIYRASPESIEPVWLGRLNIGRHFYQCEFVVANQPESLNNDVRELISLARQTGNSLSAPKRLSELSQPGQFVAPEQVFMAVSK